MVSCSRSSARPKPESHQSYDAKLLQLGVAKNLVVRRRICWQPKALAGPSAQVYIFTALTAKRPESVAGKVDTVAATTRASDNFGC